MTLVCVHPLPGAKCYAFRHLPFFTYSAMQKRMGIKESINLIGTIITTLMIESTRHHWLWNCTIYAKERYNKIHDQCAARTILKKSFGQHAEDGQNAEGTFSTFYSTKYSMNLFSALSSNFSPENTALQWWLSWPVPLGCLSLVKAASYFGNSPKIQKHWLFLTNDWHAETAVVK